MVSKVVIYRLATTAQVPITVLPVRTWQLPQPWVLQRG